MILEISCGFISPLTRAGAFLLAASLALGSTASVAETTKPADPKAVKDEGGRYYDVAGAPTYSIKPDGEVDWLTYSGYRRYHAECHVCHGPDGMGSTYAPSLVRSLKVMNFDEFSEVVVSGRQNLSHGNDRVMPSFGLNKNVMCYLDDLYVYLRARSDDALGRVRPAKRENKTKEINDAEKACLGE